MCNNVMKVFDLYGGLYKAAETRMLQGVRGYRVAKLLSNMLGEGCSDRAARWTEHQFSAAAAPAGDLVQLLEKLQGVDEEGSTSEKESALQSLKGEVLSAVIKPTERSTIENALTFPDLLEATEKVVQGVQVQVKEQSKVERCPLLCDTRYVNHILIFSHLLDRAPLLFTFVAQEIRKQQYPSESLKELALLLRDLQLHGLRVELEELCKCTEPLRVLFQKYSNFSQEGHGTSVWKDIEEAITKLGKLNGESESEPAFLQRKVCLCLFLFDRSCFALMHPHFF